jgi:hypothetical protein
MNNITIAPPEDAVIHTGWFALTLDHWMVPQLLPEDTTIVAHYAGEEKSGLPVPPYTGALPRPTLAAAECCIDPIGQVQVAFHALYPTNPTRTEYEVLRYAYLQSDLLTKSIRLIGLVDGWKPVLLHMWMPVAVPNDWHCYAYDVPKCEAALNALLEICHDGVRAAPLTDEHVCSLRALGPHAAACVDEDLSRWPRHRFVQSTSIDLVGVEATTLRWRFCSTRTVRLWPGAVKVRC